MRFPGWLVRVRRLGARGAGPPLDADGINRR